MKRLLIISEPGRDGVFVSVAGLIDHLHTYYSDVVVDFFYSSERPGPALLPLVEKIRSRGGAAVDLHIGSAPQIADIAAMIQILRYVRVYRPDVIHANSSKAGALARLAHFFPHFPPVLYTPHAYYGMSHLGGLKEFFFNSIEKFLGRFGITQNTSADERTFGKNILGIAPRSLVLIHNGIDVRRFSPVDAAIRKQRRIELGLPVEGKLLVTVGRRSHQKNYEFLYQALDKFILDSDVFFAHAGADSGVLRSTLSASAQERVFCWEHLDAPELLLQAADAFVMTSIYEGLSLSMLQALACGLVPILSDAPGLRMLKKLNFNDVLWVPLAKSSQDSLDPLLSALTHWAHSPEKNLIEQRQLVLQFFDQRIQYEKLVTLLRYLANAVSYEK